MPVDQHLLAEVSAAAGKVTEFEDQLEGARADYRRTVRRLHLSGASMREIAEALGVSHQRVHHLQPAWWKVHPRLRGGPALDGGLRPR